MLRQPYRHLEAKAPLVLLRLIVVLAVLTVALTVTGTVSTDHGHRVTVPIEDITNVSPTAHQMWSG